MKIGNLTLPSPMVVSPMAGMTDTAFRRLVKRQGGCGLVVTEMVSSEGLVRGIDRTLEYAEYTEEERPVAIQIFGGDPAKMAEAARIVEGMGANIVDVNMGCPVAKISKHNAGCRLMREPGHAATIIAAMVRAVKIPVTVKMRKGWDEDEMNAPDVARRVEDAGAAAITIHGRTAKQSYSGTADWEFVARIADALTIPVFGSGDCVEPEQIVERLRPAFADELAGKQGISGVFVGRGVLRNPWILAQAQDLLEGRPARAVSLEQRGRFLLDYIELLQDERLREEPGFRHFAPSGAIPAGLKPTPSIHAHCVTQQMEGVGFSPAVPRHDRWVINKVRALCSWYTKGFEHGAKLRISVNAAQSLDELRGLTADFFLLAPSRSSAAPARGPATLLDRCLIGRLDDGVAVTFTVEPTSLKDALIITPQHYGDGRGLFKEVFRADELGPGRLGVEFVQDNVSLSHRGVLRGLHMVKGMAKLVQVINGVTYHVIADMRPDSTTYLKWEAFELSGENHRQVFVPDGFANGFYVLSDAAYVYYKQNVYYDPAKEQIVRWDDPALGVKWPTQAPLLSDKDRAATDYRR